MTTFFVIRGALPLNGIIRCLWRTAFWCLQCVALFAVIAAAQAQTSVMPDSEIMYPGASSEHAFVAQDPYLINVSGTPTPVSLNGAARIHDFSGNVPFIDAHTGASRPWMLQAWAPDFSASLASPLDGSHNLDYSRMTNAGIPGRIDKRLFQGEQTTMVRYNAGDGITEGKCRSQLNSWPIPPRTRVRWEMTVAFGQGDGVNDWILTPPAVWQSRAAKWELTSDASPVLFWQVRAPQLSRFPALAANVDTDKLDPSKLSIYFTQRDSNGHGIQQIGAIGGLERHRTISIMIDAFLDERTAVAGGRGLIHIWVNGNLIIERAGPTLSPGTGLHYWQLDAYLWNEANPYRYTRAVFWKEARMKVFPAAVELGTQ